MGVASSAAYLDKANAAELIFEPNLTAVQQKVRDIIAKTEERPEFKATTPLERIEFLVVQQERNLVPAPEITGPGTPCYLAHAIAHRNWWKDSRDYLIVLLAEAQDWTPILIFRSEHLEFNLVDLRDWMKYGEDPHAEYRGVRTLKIEEGSYHMSTEKRLSLWRYDPGKRTLYSILSLVTEFTVGRCTPYEEFKSTASFQKNNTKSLPWLDDVILTTDWYADGFCDANGNPLAPEKSRVDQRKSIFHWNGTKYEGEIDLPEQGKKCWASHQNAWLPGKVDP